MIVSPAENLITLLTPANCVICNREGSELCSGCFITTIPTPSARCYICNKLMVDGVVCMSCRSRSRLRRTWWLGVYEAELKDLIWRIKYQRSRSIARLLAGYLADRVPFMPQDTVVMPVPTATSRVRRRGFDQAVIMAREFAAKRHLAYINELRRTNQVELIGKRRNERLKQMQESFLLTSPRSIKNKSILLIDDVLTTGATLEAAAALLRQNGAKHVDAVVIARRIVQ